VGKSQRDKGARVEREIVNILKESGIQAERVPLSGAAGGSYTGDVVVLDKFRAEVKARKEGIGFALLYKWLSDNDMLIVKQDRCKPLVVIPLDNLKEFLDEHQRIKTEDSRSSSW